MTVLLDQQVIFDRDTAPRVPVSENQEGVFNCILGPTNPQRPHITFYNGDGNAMGATYHTIGFTAMGSGASGSVQQVGDTRDWHAPSTRYGAMAEPADEADGYTMQVTGGQHNDAAEQMQWHWTMRYSLYTAQGSTHFQGTLTGLMSGLPMGVPFTAVIDAVFPHRVTAIKMTHANNTFLNHLSHTVLS